MIFRLLTRADFPQFAEWFGMPHLSQWWRESATLYLIESEGQAIGIIQSYWVADYPEHAESVQTDNAVGIDFLIGELEYIGKGVGTQLLAQFTREIIPMAYPGAFCVVADPSIENCASIRALEKAGFEKGKIVPGEDGPEQIMVLRF